MPARPYIRATTRVPGPTLEFHARAAGREIAMGGALPSGPAELSVTLDAGHRLELVWIKNGVELGSELIDADHVVRTRDVNAEAGDWFSVLVNDNTGAVLVSNAIYGARASGHGDR